MEANCITFYKFGAPEDVLKVVQKTIQPPLESEVLVKVKMRPINPSDLIPIRGAYAHRISLPSIPGYEGVGTVEEVDPVYLKDSLDSASCLYVGKGLGRSTLKHPRI